MEGGKTANYWPGFVDALTNVVIAMVFVIVVLAIALSFAAQLMGKRIAEQMIAKHVAEAAAAASSAAAAGPPARAASSTPDEAAATAPMPATRIAVRGNEAPGQAEGGRLRATPRSLQLDFAETALTLDSAAVQQLQGALATNRIDPARASVQVVGVGPALQLSENQRSAYVRVMAVRNQLIAQGFASDRIHARIDTQSRAGAPAVTISLMKP